MEPEDDPVEETPSWRSRVEELLVQIEENTRRQAEASEKAVKPPSRGKATSRIDKAADEAKARTATPGEKR